MIVISNFSGCFFYSLSGASIDASIKKIAIPLIEDKSRSGQPDLSETLTTALVDRFVNQTRLTLETFEEDADVVLTVRIDRYGNQPTAVTSEEVASLNRVTIRATAIYTQKDKDKPLLDKAFTANRDYDITEGLAGEQTAIEGILQDLADDIFTSATSNW